MSERVPITWHILISSPRSSIAVSKINCALRRWRIVCAALSGARPLLRPSVQLISSGTL
jgi:hypothetical protein